MLDVRSPRSGRRPEPQPAPPVSGAPTRPRRLPLAGLATAAVVLLVLGVVAALGGLPGPRLRTAAAQTLFGGSTPDQPASGDTRDIEVGTAFTVARDGVATGVRFYQGPGNRGAHAVHLWQDDGSLLSTATAGDARVVGWRQVDFARGVRLHAGVRYVVSYRAPRGRYSVSYDYFSAPRVHGDLTAAGGSGARNGRYSYGGGFPARTYRQSNYFVDVTFRPSTSGVAAAPSPVVTPSPTATTSARSTPATTPPATSSSPAGTATASGSRTGTSSATRAPAPAPVPSAPAGWPSAATAGVQDQSGLRRVDGDQTIDQAWMRAHSVPGTGTAADPYRMDRFLFTGMAHFVLPDSASAVLSDSRVYGGTYEGVWIESGTVTVQDTTVAPQSGGKSSIGILAYDRGTFLRNDVYGWNIGIMVQGEGPYDITDNFVHGTYLVAGDHTDLINMNPHASNGVVRHNYLDGETLDGTRYTHNGIGLYNDATPGQGTAISKNWLIDSNYITRSNYLVYAAATPPFILRNNVLTTAWAYGPFYNALSGTTDGGGNVDQTGAPVPIPSD